MPRRGYIERNGRDWLVGAKDVERPASEYSYHGPVLKELARS
jgi:hypothetical protein